MVKYYQNELDYIYFALADSTRRSILERLAQEGEVNVTALAEPFDMSLPAISKHLRVLERGGLMVQEKDGRVRRCKLAPEALREAARWIEQYSQFWETQLDSLSDYLAQVQAEGRENQEKSRHESSYSKK